MSSISTAVPQTATTQAALKPRFWGLVRGELFKITHQRLNWVLLPVLYFLCSLRWPLLLLQGDREKTDIAAQPYNVVHGLMSDNLEIVRMFVGVYLIVVTARAIGLDYQQGTIRIILARGVGRLQLLFSKLLALVLVSLAVLVSTLLLQALLACVFIGGIAGSLAPFQAINATFWADAGGYLLAVLISIGVTILLITTLTVLGRSQALGMGVGLVFFPADNIGSQVMILINRLTGSDFWLHVTAYLLGPNLNVMAGEIVLNHVDAIWAVPLVPVDGGHVLLVALVYAIIFAAIALILTRLRDVQE